MSILRGLRTEERVISYQDVFTTAVDTGGRASTAGVQVTEQRALQSLTVWGCVSLIADSLAAMPLDVYRKVKGVRTTVDPTPPVIANPYPKEMGQYDWVHRVLVSMLLRGNAFIWLTRSPTGDVLEMIPLHPDQVSIVRLSYITNDLRWYVAGQEVPRENMLHIPAFTVPGYPLGLNPIDYLRHQIGGELAATEFGNRWFADSSSPSGILSTDQNLTNDKTDEMQDRWNRAHGGRRRKTAVLSGGLKWQPIHITAEESQFLDTLKFKSHDIAGKLYRVPPHMIGDVERSTSWGTGIEQQALGYVNFTLAPWATRLERALSAMLPKPQYVKFNFDSLLRGDMAARSGFYQTMVGIGAMNPDEAREKEDLAPIPEDLGQQFFYPANWQILGKEKPADQTPTQLQLPVVEDTNQPVVAPELVAPKKQPAAAMNGRN